MRDEGWKIDLIVRTIGAGRARAAVARLTPSSLPPLSQPPPCIPDRSEQ